MARRQRPRWEAPDARSKRAVFLSHCLLNENVRYPGGATCAGAHPAVVARYAAEGIGLCQMPCPEQRAWGGVEKRYLVRQYGRRSLRWWLVRRLTVAAATIWTRAVYRCLARSIARDIADYRAAGMDVVEVVGVGGSPSCGVWTTLDLDRALLAMSRQAANVDGATANRDIVTANVIAGRGLFVEALDRALRRRHLTVSYREHDLAAELTEAGAVAS